jgi:hypothetical protein
MAISDGFMAESMAILASAHERILITRLSCGQMHKCCADTADVIQKSLATLRSCAETLDAYATLRAPRNDGVDS